MFEIFDFDANFKAYTEKWIELNQGKFKTYEQMEDAMPQVYLRWLNSPAAFLGGETPGAFFRKYSSAPELIKWLRLYDAANVNPPDQLLDRIADLGTQSLKPLLYTARDRNHSRSLRMLALNLLKEIDAGDAPFALCMELIDAREENDELAEVAGELLSGLAGNHIDEIVQRLDEVNVYAREAYLDILSNFPGDERIFEALKKEFEARPESCALFAGLLAKYGDERALDLLNAALEWENINYLDYIELKNAIEALGGECLSEREFDGDAYYEALKGANEEE